LQLKYLKRGGFSFVHSNILAEKRKNWGVSKLEEHQRQYEVEEITVAREMPHALQFRASAALRARE
jgi:hypothetical protein